jgi:peroxiredoxin (alkyl hydroperoxide reductase subunit C)
VLSCSNGQDLAGEQSPGAITARPALLIGSKIPSMELEAFYREDIRKIRLSDYKNKWLILFFYPGDFTFVCPTELREMSEHYAQFRKEGAEILSVSTDSVYVHRAWANDNEDIKKIAYPMVSDKAGLLAKSLGVYEEHKGTAMRASFVVEPGGKIIACEVHDDSIGRSAQELLRKLQAAIAVRQSDGGFCPANWKPGDEMVVPK